VKIKTMLMLMQTFWLPIIDDERVDHHVEVKMRVFQPVQIKKDQFIQGET
jgi:hypothetical protein